MRPAYTFDEINDATGFANGATFDDHAAVREYFDTETQASIFGSQAIRDENILDDMADAVISHRWHYATTSPSDALSAVLSLIQEWRNSSSGGDEHTELWRLTELVDEIEATARKA